jgi:hypothetical protein
MAMNSHPLIRPVERINRRVDRSPIHDAYVVAMQMC